VARAYAKMETAGIVEKTGDGFGTLSLGPSPSDSAMGRPRPRLFLDCRARLESQAEALRYSMPTRTAEPRGI